MYRGEYVDIRYTENVVEIYHNHQRIASHPKFPDYVTNQYATIKMTCQIILINPK